MRFTLRSIGSTGGVSGSKLKCRTRCRVELFAFPEQLPGPARLFGKEHRDRSVGTASR